MVKEIVFNPAVLKKLQEFPRKNNQSSWLLLGADEAGVVQEFFEVEPAKERCYTPEMNSSEFAKAVIGLYKKNLSPVGMYIVDGNDHHYRGAQEQYETVREWFNNHCYAFANEDTQTTDMVYVKEGLKDRTKATAGVIVGYRMLKDILIKLAEDKTA